MPFSLRQQGTSRFMRVSFLRSASAKTKHNKKIKHRSAEGWIADCVSPDSMIRQLPLAEAIAIHQLRKPEQELVSKPHKRFKPCAIIHSRVLPHA
jgi:hypothetical protein